jgi:hypothetical protein
MLTTSYLLEEVQEEAGMLVVEVQEELELLEVYLLLVEQHILLQLVLEAQAEVAMSVLMVEIL